MHAPQRLVRHEALERFVAQRELANRQIALAANAALAADPVKGAVFHHPNGAVRMTGVEVVVPDADRLPPAAAYVADAGAAKFTVANAWLTLLTLDGHRQGRSADLRPRLPLVIQY